MKGEFLQKKLFTFVFYVLLGDYIIVNVTCFWSKTLYHSSVESLLSVAMFRIGVEYLHMAPGRLLALTVHSRPNVVDKQCIARICR